MGVTVKSHSFLTPPPHEITRLNLIHSHPLTPTHTLIVILNFTFVPPLLIDTNNLPLLAVSTAYCKSSSISYPPSQSWKELEQLTCFFIRWFINDLCILHTSSHHSGSNMLMDVRQSELPRDHPGHPEHPGH